MIHHLNAVQAWRLAGIFGILVVLVLTTSILWIIRSATGRLRGAGLSIATSSLAYLLLATVVRLTVLHHRSRWQMTALLAVVGVLEAVRFRRSEGRVRATTWVAGSAAVCLGVLMTKWALEPGAFTDAFARLRTRMGP